MDSEHGLEEPKQGRLFKSPILEALSKTSFWLTFTFYPTLIALILYVNTLVNDYSVSKTIMLYISGLLIWSLVEYLMHRYLFHWADESKLVKKLTYTLHGIHHDFPKDEERLFMPPVPGLIIVSLMFSVSYIFIQKASFAFIPGLVNGYLVYVYIHHMVHVRKPIPNIRILWQHHALHHYKFPDKAFGVSSPLWDIVFRTMPPKSQQDN